MTRHIKIYNRKTATYSMKRWVAASSPAISSCVYVSVCVFEQHESINAFDIRANNRCMLDIAVRNRMPERHCAVRVYVCALLAPTTHSHRPKTHHGPIGLPLAKRAQWVLQMSIVHIPHQCLLYIASTSRFLHSFNWFVYNINLNLALGLPQLTARGDSISRIRVGHARNWHYH